MDKLAGMTVALFLLGCAKHPLPQEQIPFVGCPADGQTGPIDPPQGTPKVVTTAEVPAAEIAYYQGEQAPGAFAPRGWHCRVWFGSSGGSLIVAPAPINPPHFPQPKFHAEAIEISSILGGTSGRFEVASYASLLFPDQIAKFVQRVKGDLDTVSDFPRKPYPDDMIEKVSDFAAEFITPPNIKGLGTERFLEPSPDAIRGIAVLNDSLPDEPKLLIGRFRLGAKWRQLEKGLFRLNKECMQRNYEC